MLCGKRSGVLCGEEKRGEWSGVECGEEKREEEIIEVVVKCGAVEEVYQETC